ncbi:MAG TPA: WHG domain-containing protein [Stenomitos sp.]
MARPKGRTLTPEDLVQAAMTCLRTEGVDAVGIHRVAKAVGVKPPSVYTHIGSGAELQYRVALEGWRLLDGYLALALERDGAAFALASLATAMRAFVRDDAHLYALMLRVPLPPSGPEVESAQHHLRQAIGKVLLPMGYKGLEFVHALRIVMAALHGFLMLEGSGQFTHDAQSDDTFERLIHVLVRGLASDGRS